MPAKESAELCSAGRTRASAPAWPDTTVTGEQLRVGFVSPMLVARGTGQEAIEARPPEPVMYRLTARLLLVLLVASTLVPVAMAISAPAPHACCMRKPMHDHGSGSRDIQAVDGQHRNCCPPVTTAHWAELGSGIDSSVHPLRACLSPDLQPIRLTNQGNALRPVRGTPLS